MVFRVSEIYPSIQGEGLNVGTPTLFVRFGGCNLRCPGWPCDTPYAIDPKLYRDEWKRYTIPQLRDEIVAEHRVSNICFTGGEPFLQPRDELETLVDLLWGERRTLECFSNGTLPYNQYIADRVTFCMDWKLPSSGEDPFAEKRIKNLAILAKSTGSHAVKFVISDEDDYKLAQQLWEDHVDGWRNITTYAGVVWGRMEEKELADRIIREGLPWKLNVQTHNYIWDRTQRGI